MHHIRIVTLTLAQYSPLCVRYSPIIWYNIARSIGMSKIIRSALQSCRAIVLRVKILQTSAHNAKACTRYTYIRSDTYMHGEFTQSMWLFTSCYWFSTAFSGRLGCIQEILLSDNSVIGWQDQTIYLHLFVLHYKISFLLKNVQEFLWYASSVVIKSW